MPRVLFVLTALLSLAAATPTQNPPVPPAPPTPPTSEPIPRPTLEAMDRRELGAAWNPQIAPKLYEVHVLLEKYFSAKSAPERDAILHQLETTHLDPNIIGRLTRIRLYWPQLESGAYYINERMGPYNVMYFLGVPPNYERARPWPLVIKLPGAHAFVTDPRPTADEVVKIYTDWVNEELRKHPDALVIMPLLNLDELWGPSYVGMNSAIQPLFHAAGRVNIDPTKVYLLGHGMSGHATWNLAIHYPTWFAAINPLAGGTGGPWQKLRIANLRNIYSVVWHDAEDPVQKVDISREMVKILRTYKYDVDYEETKGVGHIPPDEIADRLYAKMRARSRDLYPKEVVQASNRPDALFNRNDWVQVYQMLASGGEHKTRFQYGSGTITLQQNSYKVTANLTAPNRIEAKTENIQSLRFYLNDQMIDFSRPLTILINGKVRFEGFVKPSMDEMLKDQLFLGRGWRYFTAYADIDFGGPPTSRPTPKAPTTSPTTGTTPRKGIIEIIPDKR